MSSTYIYVLRPVRVGMVTEEPTPDETATIQDHFNHLQDLGRQGRVLLFGRTADDEPGVFGIVVFNADSPAAAEALKDSDPAIRRGIMTAELKPFRVAYIQGDTP